MRVALIDLGTNSVRFDVQEIRPGAHPTSRLLYREKLMVRLGASVFSMGRLDPQARTRTIEAFASFRRKCQELATERIVAYATSALREAQNAGGLIQAIATRSGINLQVITGEEEARLIALGILSSMKERRRRFSLIDIGGGSTEISLVSGGRFQSGRSLPLGTARIDQLYLGRSSNAGRPDPARIAQAREAIRLRLPETLPRSPYAIGSSGTIRALHRLLRRRGEAKNGSFRKGALTRLSRELSGMTQAELLRMPGMESRRVDMILAGALLLDESLTAIGAKRMRVTDFSLRDGMLAEQLRLARLPSGGRELSPLTLHLDDCTSFATRFGCREKDIRLIADFADSLFTSLSSLHRLPELWRARIRAAALLRDIGESLVVNGHERHSAYMIRCAAIPGLEEADRDAIAFLALHHENLSPEPGAADSASLRALALLRVADALDSRRGVRPRLVGVRVTRTRVELRLAARSANELDLVWIQAKRDLFERVFRKTLIATRVP